MGFLTERIAALGMAMNDVMEQLAALAAVGMLTADALFAVIQGGQQFVEWFVDDFVEIGLRLYAVVRLNGGGVIVGRQ